MLSYLPDDKPEVRFLFMSILHTTPVGYLSLPKWGRSGHADLPLHYGSVPQ